MEYILHKMKSEKKLGDRFSQWVNEASVRIGRCVPISLFSHYCVVDVLINYYRYIHDVFFSKLQSYGSIVFEFYKCIYRSFVFWCTLSWSFEAILWYLKSNLVHWHLYINFFSISPQYQSIGARVFCWNISKIHY